MKQTHAGISTFRLEHIKGMFFNVLQNFLYIRILFVFTESIFRASAIVQSSSIKLQEKKEILRIMLYPPALSMNWKFWYKLESKFKLKLLLYNFFVISCFNLKFMFIRQIPRISYFLKQ